MFHGFPSDAILDGPVLSSPSKGTLAGENVEFGVKPEGVLPYHVDNSGYQYLYDVQTCDMDRPYTADGKPMTVSRSPRCFVPDGSETFMLTKGYPRPSSKTLPPMPFLVRRKLPGGPGALSTFASVLSVERTKQVVLSAERIPSLPRPILKHMRSACAIPGERTSSSPPSRRRGRHRRPTGASRSGASSGWRRGVKAVSCG